jgi:hypothetical protein
MPHPNLIKRKENIYEKELYTLHLRRIGALPATVVVLASMSALAASGVITIEASPINVMVNGEVFAPKDPNGNPALVFVYNGTTYAPLRVLAEAYGLEVGYDSTKNLAAVSQPKITGANLPTVTPPGAAPTGNAPEQNLGGNTPRLPNFSARFTHSLS